MPSEMNLSQRSVALKFYSGLAVVTWLGYVCHIIALAYHPSFLDGVQMSLPCIFKKLTGLPCPFCGVTRSLASFIRGDFEQAFLYNPFSLLFFSLYTYHLWVYISKTKESCQPIVSAKMYKVWLSLATLSWITKFVFPQNFW